MADRQQQPRSEGEADADSHGQQPEAEPSSAPSIDEQVEAALGRLAASGRLIGDSPPQERPEAHAPAAPPAQEGPDLEGLIERVLERRETATKERQERESVTQRLEALQRQVEGQGRRVRRWFEPWSPGE